MEIGKSSRQLAIPALQPELPLFTSMPASPVEVLVIHGEGVGVFLYAVSLPTGGWGYLVTCDEGMLAEWLEDWSCEGLRFQSDMVYSWEEALALLDRYSWPLLHLHYVHPDFLTAVREAFQSRASKHDDSFDVFSLEAWEARLGIEPRAH